jgi:hypothetical protein
MSPISPSFPDAIETAITQGAAEGVYVSMPGRVERYDRAKQRAQVQPLIKRARIDESDERQVERLPVVPNVPIAFPGVFHVEPGDIVWLVFSDFSTDRWLAGGGGEVDPGDDRRHSISNAVAFPLVTSRPRLPQSQGQLAIGRDGGPVIEWDRTEIRIGGVGAQQLLLAPPFLAALDLLMSAIATAVSDIPTGGSAAGTAIETAIESYKLVRATYLSTIVKAI